MNEANQKSSISSAILGGASTICVLVAEIRVRAYESMLIVLTPDDFAQQNINLPTETFVGPVGLTSITDDKIILYIFVIGAVFAVSAIAIGIRHYILGSRSHFMATGVVFGALSLIWQVKIYLTGV